MKPAFQRGDILFLDNQQDDPIRVGEIVVFKVRGRDIPIVHRVLNVHERFVVFMPEVVARAVSHDLTHPLLRLCQLRPQAGRGSVFADQGGQQLCQRPRVVRARRQPEPTVAEA